MSNLENANKFDEKLLKYWGLTGAKACKSCRSRQELSNEYLLAEFGWTYLLACFDTAENEPLKVCQKMRKHLTNNFWNIEVWAVQKHVNLVDLVKSFPTNIYLQNLASIQKRTSPIKFDHLAEKSEKGSISNLSTKRMTRAVSNLLSETRKTNIMIYMKIRKDTMQMWQVWMGSMGSSWQVCLESTRAKEGYVRPNP
jgi:hypothetical protein